MGIDERLVAGALAVGLMACGGRVVLARPDGTRGGDCYADGTCDVGLECYREICVPTAPPGHDAGPTTPPPPRRDAGEPLPPDPPDAGPPPVSHDVLASGSGMLIALFPTASGILVVDQSAARLMDRGGSELARFEPGREITAAAFDGTYLGISDRAKLTVLEPDLASTGETLLTEWCASAAVMSDHRFVCGPSNDWDRIFTTYDMVSLATLATSEPETYNGIPMTRVPGRDHFITVSGGSPSDLHLYEVETTGAAVYLGESPYHGDFPVRSVFSFVGDPATHVVTHQGLMLEIFAPGCDIATTSFERDCFIRDGDLGTLPVDGSYEMMTRDAAGLIYGLDDPTDRWFDDTYCEAGCVIHRVDPTARSIVSMVPHTGPFVAPVTMAHDPTSSALVLGVHTAGDRFDGYTAYEVRLASYE